MARTTITGKFATGADVATVHQISEARQRWLDQEISKATADVVVVFNSLPVRRVGTKAATTKKKRTLRKRTVSKSSGKTVRLRAKKK